jgi:hypothetical protein
MSQDTVRADHPLSMSPPLHRPRHCGGKRVVERASSNITYPTLTRSNYIEWSLVMMVNLQATRLWDVVESGIGNYREDQSALTAILCAVLQEMQAGLVVKRTTQEVWEAIQKIQLSTDRVKEANAERLWREFGDLTFKPSESVKDFSLWLTTMASQL